MKSIVIVYRIQKKISPNDGVWPYICKMDQGKAYLISLNRIVPFVISQKFDGFQEKFFDLLHILA